MFAALHGAGKIEHFVDCQPEFVQRDTFVHRGEHVT
jgi:hypothetical protein